MQIYDEGHNSNSIWYLNERERSKTRGITSMSIVTKPNKPHWNIRYILTEKDNDNANKILNKTAKI